MLADPVEQQTFNNVSLSYTVARNHNANDYWGLQYRIETKLVILHGDPPGEIQENIITKTSGTFSEDDPNYYNKFNCPPIK